MPEGFKIPLTLDKATKAFIGTSATDFATELGIIVRDVFPMRFHKWDSVPEDVKTLMYEKLEGCFESALEEQWRKNESKVGKSNMHGDCRNQDDWNHLCDYWESKKTRKYSDQMELNRRKQVNISRGLSVNSQSCIHSKL
ncbi:hypothetical protein HanRHA438_Chr15g0731011 [Helianthus annuus]|uniref:Uncharacterized protein n=1 Tax=Helianthus annuus TaxID=4232 RepID=A0A9K3E603_HELAN|nr:hypothetical protein HanXRQr2_Chr15g0718711 [Helianthus annuus]KAJ0453065.1 hypothetical protein HanHA300_Chr15g0586161 [Helianthus annuus]KAJ0474975.1 hypothetical protein HanHA89_Chr15g0635901 [Helianthus annuus]KAJ0650530.1 hypothetical protein HanLR1_Chr15g0596811 [Helianthus annuus]KAJ0654283.1 hypothetical protein HanOQP8_Chr15g0593231 [Helianthus annuus]